MRRYLEIGGPIGRLSRSCNIQFGAMPLSANEARDERLRNEGRLDERARVLDVDALAPAYHRVGCILGKSVAFHSCKYRDAHRRTMASLVALLAGARP